MCYYRRLHFVPCSHLYWIANPVIRYCPAAQPVPDNNDLSTIHGCPPDLQLCGRLALLECSRSRAGPHGSPSSCSTPSTSPARRHSSPSIFSTPLRKADGDSMSPPSSSNSSPSNVLYSRARRLGDQPRNVPCSMRLSHPLMTYRIFTVCPGCKAVRDKQEAGLGALKKGLEDARMIVDRLSALEDTRARAEEADVESNDEERAWKEELRRLGGKVGR